MDARDLPAGGGDESRRGGGRRDPRPADVLAGAATTPAEAVLTSVESRPEGLTGGEAARRLGRFGRNEFEAPSRPLISIILSQFHNGIMLLLIAAGLLTLIVGDRTNGILILGLVLVNFALGILQEYRAERKLAALRELLPAEALVVRDGRRQQVPIAELVPGDVLVVRPGDRISADVRLLSAEALEADQSTLTGESVPSVKTPEAVRAGTPAPGWSGVLFAGTTVSAGHGLGVVVATGRATRFGETAALAARRRARSDFDVNLSRFGYALLIVGLAIAAVVFAVNAFLGRGVVASLTLGLAVSLGVVPEALPAVIATTLGLGALALARKRVLVRRLSAVEDLSTVDILCIDKTGTITENRTTVARTWSEVPVEQLLAAAALCSTGLDEGPNVIDAAVWTAATQRGLTAQEIGPERRRVVVSFTSQRKWMAVETPSNAPGGGGGAGEPRHIYKGAAGVLLEHCHSVLTADGAVGLDRDQVNGRLAMFEEAGARVIAVAEADDPRQAVTEGGPGRLPALMLIGLLGLADPPRAGAGQTLDRAEQFDLSVKIVTGDARARAVALAKQLDLRVDQNAVVGAEALRDGQSALAEQGRIFADAEPADKFKLVRLLQEDGHRVAVTGDGVNDAPALTTADVGLALASGSDAAKQSADLVLVEDDLRVIVDGIQEGRRTFTTINRYLVYTLVSNFATVLVVTIASYLLPELPLLPAQVLLLTILPDLSMLVIATDGVAAEDLRRTRHWRIRGIVTISLWFGIVNTLYTFGLLRTLIHAPVAVLRSALFLYLAVTALLVLVNVRTSNWSWKAPRPSREIVAAVAGSLVVPFALIDLPPLRTVFGFGPLPPLVQLGIVGLAIAYVATLDLLKWALRHSSSRGWGLGSRTDRADVT